MNENTTDANPRYSEEILIEALEENLADDPYGTVMFATRNLIHRAITVHEGTMSTYERQNLIALEEFLRVTDNG